MGRMSAPHDSPPVRKSWLRFSLASLFLLTALICVAVAYLLQRSELRRKDAEIRQYRIDLGLLDDRPGVLVVDDPSKVYVAALPSLESLHWRWRIYLPPTSEWSLKCIQGCTSDFGLAKCSSIKSTGLNTRGEFMLEARVERELGGDTKIVVRCGNQSLSSAVDGTPREVLRGHDPVDQTVCGTPKQQSYAPQGNIELLRWYRAVPGDDDWKARVGGPFAQFGFMILLKEVSKSD